jgi:hypothetical protein
MGQSNWLFFKRKKHTLGAPHNYLIESNNKVHKVTGSSEKVSSSFEEPYVKGVFSLIHKLIAAF